MSICSPNITELSETFRVTPSFRDRLQFSASMIDPTAMDEELQDMETELPEAAVKHHNWGWWSLVAPFIL
jgi:hypothetical protein